MTKNNNCPKSIPDELLPDDLVNALQEMSAELQACDPMTLIIPEQLELSFGLLPLDEPASMSYTECVFVDRDDNDRTFVFDEPMVTIH